MNPQDPLAQLQPLRDPAAIGWWPPAPGWWLLAALILLALAGLGYLLWRRYQRNGYRRQALRQLRIIAQECPAAGDRGASIAQINALLKTVALQRYPRARVAGLSGEAWLAFLHASEPGASEPFPPDLGEAMYQQHLPATDLDQLVQRSARWIRRHGEPA